MDRVTGQYAIYGLDDVILNTEGRMQMRYNIAKYTPADNKTINVCEEIFSICKPANDEM